jgi:tetratricopeptide (TPR) repeat protein
MKPAVAVLGLILIPSSLSACLWDTDTLAAEAKGIPEVIQVITGRFERNPPLYYEMRLKRATEEIKKYPDDWEAYDDAGVACDWLGRGDEAIAWMEKKRERLDKADATNPKVKEHRYRYLANVGTFWAHRWFRQGAKLERIDQMKTAREFTRQAIALNPDAHFGREKYQLLAMDWIITPLHFDPKTANHLPDFLGLGPKHTGPHIWDGHAVIPDHPDLKDPEKALAGLIVLGGGWHSVDFFYSLSLVLNRQGKSAASYLASLRCDELIGEGMGSFLPDAPNGKDLKKLVDRAPLEHRRQEEELEEFVSVYRSQRDEADAWHKERTWYMLERMKDGRHPDTDPGFWDDYEDAGPPPLPDPLFGHRGFDYNGRLQVLIYGGVALASVFLLILCMIVAFVLIKKRRRTRLARSTLQQGFTDQQIARMNELAERNEEGLLSAEERAELLQYVKVGDQLSLLQLKARRYLKE